MKFVTAAEMRKIDQVAIEDYGIPSLILMENAGIACANEAFKLLKSKDDQVVVFSGNGNNGGDGFVVARHLANHGFKVIVFYFKEPNQMKPDPFTNFEILEKMGVQLIACLAKELNIPVVERILGESKLVVDALFGTGLSRLVHEPFKTAITQINQSKLPVISVDVPSGLNSDTGAAMGECVRSKITVTLGLPKKGFKMKTARRYLGHVVVADISLPKQLLN